MWGGTPRYWELAADHPDLPTAIRTLVLSPLGVLFEEPQRLLLDDLRDTTQAASILSLIGAGCHRISEIAARLEKPVTALSRPLQRLQDMDLVHRELPFGEETRGGKRTLYKISDPFLRFWFRYVEPNRSRLGAGLSTIVEKEILERLGHHVGEIWEELARASASPRDRRQELGTRRPLVGAWPGPPAARDRPDRREQRRPEHPGRRGQMGFSAGYGAAPGRPGDQGQETALRRVPRGGRGPLDQDRRRALRQGENRNSAAGARYLALNGS